MKNHYESATSLYISITKPQRGEREKEREQRTEREREREDRKPVFFKSPKSPTDMLEMHKLSLFAALLSLKRTHAVTDM